MWKALKGSDDKQEDRKRYRCQCGSSLVFVVNEPVERKVRSRSSHRRRLVAQCPVCGFVRRISLGGPN
jgi:RNase P subunit RPR2